MAASFLLPADLPTADRPAPDRAARPALVVLDGGRSSSAQRRRRMYLQRRVAAAAVALVVAVGLVSAASSLLGAAAPAGAADSPVASSYEVAPGDTLWSIAGSLDLDADRRQVVDLLADANGGSVIRPGQRLVIPASVTALG